MVRERNANRRSRDAVVMQLIVGSILSKKASKELATLLGKVAESD